MFHFDIDIFLILNDNITVNNFKGCSILMKTSKKQITGIVLVILSCLAVYCVIWAFTGEWPYKTNPYNSYILQAKAWISGRLDLGQNYTHLELAVFGGKYYVSFPPLPSILLAPFAVTGISDNYAAAAVSCLVCVFALKLCKSFSNENACFLAMFFSLASNVLVVSINSWVWFIAQNFSLLFTLCAFYFAKEKRGVISLAALSLAVLCRPFQIVYFPFLCLILSGENNVKVSCKCFVIPIILGISCMIFNFARFGNPLEFGHNYLPEFTSAPRGQFDISYISENAKSLVRLPTVSADGKILFPEFNGMSVFLCFPIIIFCLIFSLVKINKTQTFAGIVTVMIHILLLLSHKTMGGYHFGNRYFIDVMPCMFYLLLYNFPRNSRRAVNVMYPFFVFGLCLNIVGAVKMFG